MDVPDDESALLWGSLLKSRKEARLSVPPHRVCYDVLCHWSGKFCSISSRSEINDFFRLGNLSTGRIDNFRLIIILENCLAHFVHRKPCICKTWKWKQREKKTPWKAMVPRQSEFVWSEVLYNASQFWHWGPSSSRNLMAKWWERQTDSADDEQNADLGVISSCFPTPWRLY